MNEERKQQRKTWKKEESAGGIVFKKQDNQIFILLIIPSFSERHPTYPIWTFPKGWIHDHPDETIEQSAVREVREEGGVDAKIVSDLGQVKYFFKWQGENIFKIVHWFLMEYVLGGPNNHDLEVKEAKWIEINEVEKFINYKTDKEIFSKAKERLIKE